MKRFTLMLAGVLCASASLQLIIMSALRVLVKKWLFLGKCHCLYRYVW